MASAGIGKRWMLALAAIALASVGCTTPRLAAAPAGLTVKARVPGYTSTIRYFPGDSGDVESLKQDVLDAATRQTT
jgi:hypothetical protein